MEEPTFKGTYLTEILCTQTEGYLGSILYGRYTVFGGRKSRLALTGRNKQDASQFTVDSTLRCPYREFVKPKPDDSSSVATKRF